MLSDSERLWDSTSLVHTIEGSNVRYQVFYGHPRLSHAKFNRLNGVRRLNWVVFGLMGLNKCAQHIDTGTGHSD